MKLTNIEDIFESCDADKSGYIDYNEFITATINWKQALSSQKLEAAFQAFDVDHNGVITCDELKIFLGGAGADQDKVWQAILKEADANGDGEINIREFKEIITKNIV